MFMHTNENCRGITTKFIFYLHNAMPLYSSAFVHHKSFCRNSWMEQAGFWRGVFFQRILLGVLRKLRYMKK